MSYNIDEKVQAAVAGFILENAPVEEAVQAVEPNPVWEAVSQTGTELWLDTGDLDGAAEIWDSSFQGLTTNNTLLNNEIQKGIYDELIPRAGQLLKDLPEEQRIMEISFILNAIHGLRLVRRFNARVSVELHTGAADDVDMTLSYARRFHAISPDKFIVKIPMTPAGLLATRRVRDEGIPVNFTLGFSARQNLFATVISRPSFVNVFLGRCGAYCSSNKLGDGRHVGEKATLASQQVVAKWSAGNEESTRQIAASMRSGQQVFDLAGVDVFTMPIKAAVEAAQSGNSNIESRREIDYEVAIPDGKHGLQCLWEITAAENKLAAKLQENVPASPAELMSTFKDHGVPGFFLEFSPSELTAIREDGKIPVHTRWAQHIERGSAAPDSLLNLAAFQSFSADQKALDDRIRRFI